MTVNRDKTGKFPAYTDLGLYPIYYIMSDYKPLCAKCANSDAPVHTDPPSDDWRIIDSSVNFEDTELYCVHCGDKIEAAYVD